MRSIRLAQVALLALATILWCPPAHAQASVLFDTINERLSYMEDVALFKMRNRIAVEDIEREKVVLASAKKAAGDIGLDPERVEGFFSAQISVAKAIQYRHLADWLSEPPSAQPRDLNEVVRPALLFLGDQIIRKLADHIEQHGGFTADQYLEFAAAITVRHVSDADKKMLFAALLDI